MEDAALAGDGQEQIVAPEQQEAAELSQAPEESAPQPGEQVPVSDNVERKIGKVTGKMYAEKRRADAAEAELAKYKAAQPIEPEAKAPVRDDFDYDDDAFIAATIEYQVKRGVGAEAKRIQDQAVTAGQVDAQAQIDQSFNDRASEYVVANPGYQEAIKNLPVFNNDTLNLIKGSGPEMAAALANNLELAYEIVNASPMEAAMKIGVLSTQLNAAPQIKPSAAPAPIEPITPGGGIAPNSGTKGMTFE